MPKPRPRELEEEEVRAATPEDQMDALTLLERQHEENKRRTALIKAELGL